MNKQRDPDREYQETKTLGLSLIVLFTGAYLYKHEREIRIYYETNFELIWMGIIGFLALLFWIAKKRGDNKRYGRK